jgi:type IV fimbrial biogenesis protein FimT
MQKFRVIRHARRLKKTGFTLVELMVTLAVLAILAFMATPSIQQFVAKSEMNGLQNDFMLSLNRARTEAVARNTCVSICSLASGTTSSCDLGSTSINWEQGWVLFENPTCGSPADSGTYDLTGTDASGKKLAVLQVRQPRNTRYTLQASIERDFLTYNARGQLQSQAASFVLTDSELSSVSPHARKISLSPVGRATVAAYDPVAEVDSGAEATASGDSGVDEEE